jgi:hypothetical protein
MGKSVGKMGRVKNAESIRLMAATQMIALLLDLERHSQMEVATGVAKIACQVALRRSA